MQKLLWIVMPFVLFGCLWERDRGRDHYHWWGYEESHDHHGYHDHDKGWHEHGRDRTDACVPDASASTSDDEDASVAQNEVAVMQDAGKPRCESDSDCDATSYCEVDSGDCLPGTTCEDESSCEPGFNCDAERAVCLPADMERCSEMADEAACAERSDCMSTYAGINCTCGPDCTCMGGEPNCVCERFEFHSCDDVVE